MTAILSGLLLARLVAVLLKIGGDYLSSKRVTATGFVDRKENAYKQQKKRDRHNV